jgi:hypothetical protein
MNQFFFIPAFRHLSEIYCVAGVAVEFYCAFGCGFYGIFSFLCGWHRVCQAM